MIFSRNEHTTSIQSFPCLTLNSAPSVVPLPGILYKINFERTAGDDILGHYKSSSQYHAHFLLTEVTDGSLKMSPKAVEAVEKFRQKFDSKDDLKSLYICLIPAQSFESTTGCICKITGVLMEDKAITISFKALNRAILKSPPVKSDKLIWTNNVSINDDFSSIDRLKDEQLNLMISEFVKLFGSIDATINTFKKQYKQSFKKKSSHHLLLLSPLSNTLFFQLSKAQFNKAWNTILGFVAEVIDSMETVSPSSVAVQIVTLMDLIVTVLPTSTTQKFKFLSSLQLNKRCENFKNIVNDFVQIFDKLYTSSEYVQRYFSQATNLEKSRLIANQLQSLRFYIEDVKAQNKPAIGLTGQKKKTESLISSSFKEDSEIESKDQSDDGDEDFDEDDENEKLKKFIKDLPRNGVHPDGIKMLRKDFKRFSATSPQNSEYQVLRSYFDIICDVPFGKYSKRDNIDLDKSRQKLDLDHYGLKNVKKRLLEYLCILKLNGRLAQMNETKKRAPILLLVGPPGVGKTSIAKSIAEMLNLKFQRVSLGGVHNEAEIRGHRRTYVGSMCGLIISAMRKSGCMNPLILLDEVDKVLSTTSGGSGYGNKLNGDPGAALLEVLDPEQNNTFMDHYVGFPIDLSQVLFFCTANDLSGISAPLLDRMEVIEIPGYTPEEKIQIGSTFLLPKQIRINGLDICHEDFKLTKDAWESLVLEYTREAGVRNLERQIAAVVRGRVVEYVQGDIKAGDNEKNTSDELPIISKKALYKYLGFPLHPISSELLAKIRFADKEGVVNGLSYNSDGTGSVLIFEIVKTGSLGKSTGPEITATGNLGNVLQESIDIGCSLVKSILKRGIMDDADQEAMKEFLSSEYHLHVPMGAVSKDGPSAGTAITLALMSLALNRPVDPLLCMTGEITLRGKILPIGGIKEKLLGARLYGMKRVLVPLSNRSDVVQAVTDDIVPFIQSEGELMLVREKMGLSLTYVNDIYDVIQYVWSDIALHNETPVEHSKDLNEFKI